MKKRVKPRRSEGQKLPCKTALTRILAKKVDGQGNILYFNGNGRNMPMAGSMIMRATMSIRALTQILS
ncbi:MAG: hypothetical protein QW457_08295 [Candidatus Bathyarchaeia archaeon]